MRRVGQNGSAHVVVIIILVVVLLGALGWIFYQNFLAKKDQETQTTTTQPTKTDNTKKKEAPQAAVEQAKYVDFRTGGKDDTGTMIASAGDVAKLTGASQALKDFFTKDVGEQQMTIYGDSIAVNYKIDRLYGSYAVGSSNAAGAYLIWGPKDGTGAITDVAGTQNEGFQCDKLKVAKVPAELVDGKCYNFDGSNTGAVEYKL